MDEIPIGLMVNTRHWREIQAGRTTEEVSAFRNYTADEKEVVLNITAIVA